MKQFFIFLVLFSSAASIAQNPFSKTVEPSKYEGDKPYTPTRMEWVVSEYRNECGVWLNGIPTVSWGLFDDLKDTVRIVVRFTDEKIRTEAQQGAETCARNIRALTRGRGWNWLKTALEVGNRDVGKNPKGFKLTSVPAKSAFANLDLKPGDTIRTVNYTPVSSEFDAQKIGPLLKAKKLVRVEFEREGMTWVNTNQ